MYDFIRDKGGKSFVNADNPLLIKQTKGIELIKYGKSTDYFMAGEPASTDNYLVVKALFRKDGFT